MALIQPINTAQAFTDKALILGYREARQYALNIETYSILRVGLLLSAVSASTTRPVTGAALTPNQTAANEKDKIWIGVRSGTTGFPDGDAAFMGMVSQPRLQQTNPPLRGVCTRYSTAGTMSWGTYMSGGGGQFHDRVDFREQLHVYGYYDPDANHSDPGLAMFNVIEFHIGNAGTPTQEVVIKCAGHSGDPFPTDGGVYTPEDMSANLSDHAWRSSSGALRTITAASLNKDGSALALPKNLFIYWPFSNSRLCIHGVVVEAVE